MAAWCDQAEVVRTHAPTSLPVGNFSRAFFRAYEQLEQLLIPSGIWGILINSGELESWRTHWNAANKYLSVVSSHILLWNESLEFSGRQRRVTTHVLPCNPSGPAQTLSHSARQLSCHMPCRAATLFLSAARPAAWLLWQQATGRGKCAFDDTLNAVGPRNASAKKLLRLSTRSRCRCLCRSHR